MCEDCFPGFPSLTRSMSQMMMVVGKVSHVSFAPSSYHIIITLLLNSNSFLQVGRFCTN